MANKKISKRQEKKMRKLQEKRMKTAERARILDINKADKILKNRTAQAMQDIDKAISMVKKPNAKYYAQKAMVHTDRKEHDKAVSEHELAVEDLKRMINLYKNDIKDRLSYHNWINKFLWNIFFKL